MMDVRSLHKYMELDQINSISVSTGDIQVLVLSSKYPGIYFRSCDESSFTVTKTHGDALAFTQRIPFWNSELRRGRPSLSWLWANPLLVIALREQNALCEFECTGLIRFGSYRWHRCPETRLQGFRRVLADTVQFMRVCDIFSYE